MTTPHPEPTAWVPICPTHVIMPDYILICDECVPPPREFEFTAISDDHAVGLMQKEYADTPWTLYRLTETQRQLVFSYPGK